MATSSASVPAETSGSSWKTLLLFLLFAWMLRSFILAPFSIPSGSMLPRLLVGDYLLVAKWPYGYSQVSFPFGFPPIRGRLFSRLPERGDVVVFRGPQGNDVIKRVIGLPGDQVATRGGRLVLNGRTLTGRNPAPLATSVSPNSPCRVVPPAMPRMVPTASGEQCVYPVHRETMPDGESHLVIDQVERPDADEFGPVTVPPGTVFVMGDNRDDSADSRFAPPEGMGYVPVDRLVGRALVIFWSTDGSARWLLPWTWFTALRPERIGGGF